jgi:hypothetical protein
MTAHYDPERLVVLANGARVPFEQACLRVGTVTAYLEDPSLEWDMVHLLRQVCLGNTIDPEQTRALVREKLLQPDGTVEPILEAIVLSAVRGEGRLLRLESPFTDPLDRATAEFFLAREYVRNHMEAPDATAFLTHDPLQKSFEEYRKGTDPGSKWT